MHNNYETFIQKLDEELKGYFEQQKENICCHKSCSECCEKGDYPLSELELKYLMQGYINLDNDLKIEVQKNFQSMVKGEKCPFLVDKLCSVYDYRPIVCRVHGLAYLLKSKKVKVPYCAQTGKNFSKLYKEGEIYIAPIENNLETPQLLKDIDCGEIRNLYDWLTSTSEQK